jgi:hypothetical protein
LTRTGAPDIAFSDVLEQLNAVHTELLNAEDPTAVGFDSHHLGPQFLPILQHTGITAIAVGLTTTNPTNEVNRKQNAPTEPEGMKYVWASLDKLGGLALRAWRGRRVPTAHVAFMPGVNPNSLLAELRARRSSCEVRLCFHHTNLTSDQRIQNLCLLHVTGVVTLSELHWVKTNLTVVGSALELADRLMATDQEDAQAPKLRQDQYMAKVAPGIPFVNALKQHVAAKHAIHIDHVTIAFATAYLDFYLPSPTLGLNPIVQPRHDPRLLVQIAVKHSIKSRGDEGLLRLRP